MGFIQLNLGKQSRVHNGSSCHRCLYTDSSTDHSGSVTQDIPQLRVTNPLPQETEQMLCVQDDLSLRKS